MLGAVRNHCLCSSNLHRGPSSVPSFQVAGSASREQLLWQLEDGRYVNSILIGDIAMGWCAVASSTGLNCFSSSAFRYCGLLVSIYDV